MQRTHQDTSLIDTARARLDAQRWLQRRQAWERRLGELEGRRAKVAPRHTRAIA